MKALLLAVCFFVALSSNSQSVFKTPSGAKYHLVTCRMVKNVSEELSIIRAKKLGLTACKICHPNDANIVEQPVVHKAQGEDASSQCKGNTKKGTRCQHMTKIANGYCFQHQPK